MAKKTIQDIFVVKKNIRMVKKGDIGGNFHHIVKKAPILEKQPKEDFDQIAESIIEENIIDDNFVENKKHITKDSLMFLWIVCIASIAVLLFFLSSNFATATLTITPKSQTIALNDAYNIVSDRNASGLHFQVMTIKKELSANVETDGTESVERKAIGKAILYNNFSSASQRLINNTRLQTKDGLTYRIRESVNIPGIKTVAGVKTPGSIEIEIIADMPGDKYNMKVSDLKGDFTIPGFKGSTKFTAFYGRLSEDMVGGFVGDVKKVSDATLISGRSGLLAALKADLIKEVYLEKPQQYALFKDSYYTECRDLADDSSGSEYKISEECVIHAVAFDKDELSSFIAKSKIKDFDGSKVDVIWNDNDSVSLLGATEKPWNETSLRAKFSGPAQVVWYFDSEKILSAVAGQDKSVINSVIQDNKKSLTEIQASIRPMWKNTFPENSGKIKIVDTIRSEAK